MGYHIERRHRSPSVAIFEFDADECEAIAYALGPGDGGATEMLEAAAELRLEES